jgi:hypothetical protein
MLIHSKPGIVLIAILVALAAALPSTAAPPAQSDTWTKYFGEYLNTLANDVLPTEDGGYYIVGGSDLDLDHRQRGNIYLLRVDASGEVVWEKIFDSDMVESGNGLTLMRDGNLLISAQVTSPEDGGMDTRLLKVDQDGNELWSKTYGGPLDEMIGGGAPTADGGYLLGGIIVDPNDIIVDDPGVAGYGGLSGRSNIFLMKIDGDGNELWSRHYDSDDNIIGGGAARTDDGSVLILATILRYPANDDDMVLMKIDEDGDVVWTRTWEEDRISGRAIVQTSDGNYLIAAAYSSADDPRNDMLLIKVDPEGNEIWRSMLGDPDRFEYIGALSETSDGGFVVAAEYIPDLYTWESELALVKLDADGQMVWEQTKTGAHTMYTSVMEHVDGGYVIVGSTLRVVVFNIMLTKTDAEGHLE